MLPVPRPSAAPTAAAPRVPALALVIALGMVLLPALPAHSAPSPGGCPVIADSFAIRAIELEGLRTTRRQVVLRELIHRPGDLFSCDIWEEEKSRLEDLDIFSEVEVRPRGEARAPAPGKTRGDTGLLVYSFRELPPYIPFVAVSKTEQDGLSLGPALASLNFLGRDIRAEFITRFGGTTELVAAVTSPWIGDLPVEYDLAAIRVDSYNHFEDFHEESWRIKLDLMHRIGGKSQLLYNGELLGIRSEGGGTPAGPRVTLSPGADLIPRLGFGYLWDGRDRRHNARSGVYQEVRWMKSGGWLGGDADYSEWLSDTRLYLPWLERNVLYAGGLYQYRTGAVGRTFPVYDRFHAGGINTLRGYGNDAFQGKSEWILTLENRVDIFRKQTFRLWKWGGYLGLQGIAGVEGASLWDHHALLESNFHAGAFVGLHLLMAGIDRIRLEIGSKTAKLQFRLDVGIMEKADVQRFRAR